MNWIQLRMDTHPEQIEQLEELMLMIGPYFTLPAETQ